MPGIVNQLRRGLSSTRLNGDGGGGGGGTLLTPRHNSSSSSNNSSVSAGRIGSSNSGGGRDRGKPGRTLASRQVGTTLKFEAQYRLKQHLSKGSFGVVHVAEHVATGQEFAVKVIEVAKLSEKERLGVEREVSILNDCRDVINIVQLVDFFVSPQHFYVVQGYAEGGDVFERLAQRTSYTESLARTLAKNLLSAVDVLASRKLAHRDLKPENLLLRDVLDDSSIVVADFGFASYVPEGGLKTRCGTPAFVGPEVLVPHCRYDERCDMWSVGCLLYMLIAGYPPFQDRNHKGLFKKVRGADFVFHDTYWRNVSIPAKQLITNLLTVDPRYRWTARQALDSSPWLLLDEALLKSHDLSASLGEIKKFHAKRTLNLKGAVQTAMLNVKQKFKSTSDVENLSPSSASSAPVSPKAVANALIPDLYDDSEGWDKEGTSANLNQEEHIREPIVKENSDSVLLRTGRPVLGFYDLYKKGSLLHSGQTAKVYECRHKASRAVFAVKIVERKERSPKSAKRTMAEAVLYEVAILDSLRHKNVVEIKDFFEDDDYFFLVMDRMLGGDVFERILELKRYSERDARKLMINLLEATAFFHAQNVAHRDLKPQNLLLKSKDNLTDIMICDFGFASRVLKKQSLTNRCGTPSYVAPEVLKNAPYDQMVDMWSIGVILFVLLCGYPPFADENQTELFRKIRMGEWKFRGEEWEQVSDEAKDLIRGLLVPNPVQRLSAEQALQCTWLRQGHKVRVAQSPPVVSKKADVSHSALQEETFNRRQVRHPSRSKTSSDANKQSALGSESTIAGALRAAPNNRDTKSQPELTDKPTQGGRKLGPEHLRKFEI